MIWRQEEQELIELLDKFVLVFTKLEKFSNNNPYRLIQQILLLTKGEFITTQNLCSLILNADNVPVNQEREWLQTLINNHTEQVINNNQKNIIDNIENSKSLAMSREINSHSKSKNTPSSRKNINSFWTLIFLLLIGIIVFFVAKRPTERQHKHTNYCPKNLVTEASQAIQNRSEISLVNSINNLEQFSQQHQGEIDSECQKIFLETQFVYAIDFLASRGEKKAAVQILCNIPEDYYQNKASIPWFTRWSNTNPEFREWLTTYRLEHQCPSASFLE